MIPKDLTFPCLTVSQITQKCPPKRYRQPKNGHKFHYSSALLYLGFSAMENALLWVKGVYSTEGGGRET